MDFLVMRRKNKNVVTLKDLIVVFIIGGIPITFILEIILCRGSYVA